MKLAAYLIEPGQTATGLADQVKTSVSTITRLAKGDLKASHDLMERIYAATGGRVTPNDLVGVDPDELRIAS